MTSPAVTAGAALVVSRLDRPETEPGLDLVLFCPCLAGLPAMEIQALSLLPIEDANGALLAQGDLLRVNTERVFACIFAADPFRSVEHLLRKMAQFGVTSVANFPTVGLFDDDMLASLDRLGLGLEREVDLIHRAVLMGLRTAAVVPDEHFAREFARAGAGALLVPTWLSPRVQREIRAAADGLDVPVRDLRIRAD